MSKIIAICLAFISSLSYAQHHKYKIDGKIDEWNIPLNYYDDGTKLNYTIINDDSAFYICIRALEESTQMRMLNAGFQISVDPKAKKSQKFNLLFKGNPSLPSNLKSNEIFSLASIRKEFNKINTLVSLSGFKGVEDDTYIASTLQELSFAIKFDTTNSLNIEYKIPFKSIGLNSVEQEISIGIILTSIKSPTEGLPSMGGMPPSDKQPPNGMPPPQSEGIPTMAMKGNSDMLSEKKVWTKFKIVFLK